MLGYLHWIIFLFFYVVRWSRNGAIKTKRFRSESLVCWKMLAITWWLRHGEEICKMPMVMFHLNYQSSFPELLPWLKVKHVGVATLDHLPLFHVVRWSRNGAKKTKRFRSESLVCWKMLAITWWLRHGEEICKIVMFHLNYQSLLRNKRIGVMVAWRELGGWLIMKTRSRRKWDIYSKTQANREKNRGSMWGGIQVTSRRGVVVGY